MRRALLPLLLAATVTLTPGRAQAGENTQLLVGVITAGVMLEVLTLSAAAKNYSSAHNDRDPSAAWVGVGGVGSLINLGIGGVLLVDGLPSSSASGNPDAKPAQIVIGTLMTGIGAFSLTMAIQAAVTSAPKATVTSAAPLMAPVGFMLPPIAF